MPTITYRDPAAFPSDLYSAPRPAFRWLGAPTFRVWPAGNYRRHVELEAANEHCARVAGSIRLGVSGEKVRVQRVPGLKSRGVA